MLEFLKWLGVFAGTVFVMAGVAAICACVRSGQISREEETDE